MIKNNQWKSIAANGTPAQMQMCVFIAKDILPFDHSVFPYTSDPYCGWFDGKKYVRWPHQWFKPTHYIEIEKFS